MEPDSLELIQSTCRNDPDGIPLPWGNLSEHGGELLPASLTVFGGRTGHAKTTVMVSLVRHLIEQNEVHNRDEICLFYSLEERQIDIGIRILALLTAELSDRQKGWTYKQIQQFYKTGSSHAGCDPNTLVQAENIFKNWCNDRRFQTIDVTNWGAQKICAHVQQVAETRKVTVVAIDCLQKVPVVEDYERRDLAISAMASTFKNTAKQTGIPFVLAAQINREAIPVSLKKELKGKSYVDALPCIRGARPALHNLREGGSEQEADLVIGILNCVADYDQPATENEYEIYYDIPSVTHVDFGILKGRRSTPGYWESFDFHGKYGWIKG